MARSTFRSILRASARCYCVRSSLHPRQGQQQGPAALLSFRRRHGQQRPVHSTIACWNPGRTRRCGAELSRLVRRCSPCRRQRVRCDARKLGVGATTTLRSVHGETATKGLKRFSSRPVLVCSRST